ncbi:MAG: hypothetical protein IJ581_01160 [Paludibacteraceae bacterium]|nr:hypothetical protein [Paludibacteraceae bacterium]
MKKIQYSTPTIDLVHYTPCTLMSASTTTPSMLEEGGNISSRGALIEVD